MSSSGGTRGGSSLTWPLALSTDEAFRPTNVASSALVLHNPASAVSGVLLSGDVTNGGATGKNLLNTGPQFTMQSAVDTHVSIRMVPVGAGWWQFVQSPQQGGIVVATSTDNFGWPDSTSGNGYGSGMFNGCMQIFRPTNTSTRDNAMPWLLLGNESGLERGTTGIQTYTPPASFSFTSLLDSIQDDWWFRGFGIATAVQTIRFGIGQGASGAGQANLNGSALAVTNGANGNTGTFINGITVTGSKTGVAPSISVHTIPTVTGQTGDTNDDMLVLGLGASSVRFGNTVSAQHLGVGIANASAYIFSNAGVGDAVVWNDLAAGKIHFGSSNGGGFSSFQVLQNLASQVNGVRAFGNITATAPGVSAVGTDTNIDFQIAPKGSGVLYLSYAATALGGGAAPTLGTIGGSGPATAAQSSWLAVKINGTASFLPVWR